MFFNRKSKSQSRESISAPSGISQDLKATRKAGIRTAILVTMLVSGVVPAVCMMFSSTDDAIPFSQYLQQMWSIALLTYPLTIVVAMLTILRKRGVLSFGNLFLTVSIVIFCGSVGNAIGVFGGHETVGPPTTLVSGFTNGQAGPVQYSNVPMGNYPPNSFQNAGYGNNSNGAPGSIRYATQPQSQFGSPSRFGTQYGATQNNGTQYGGQVVSGQPSAFTPAQSDPQGSSGGLLLGIPAACLGFFSSYYHTYGMRTFLASVLVGMFAGNTANRFLVHVPKNRNETVGLAKELYESRLRSK